MTSFDLGRYCVAKFTPVRDEFGYVAKGVVFYLGRAAVTFEARSSTIPDTERAAWGKAQEVYARLMTEKRKAKGRLAESPDSAGKNAAFRESAR